MKKERLFTILTCIAGLALSGCDDPVVASDKDVRKDGKVVDVDTVANYNAQEDLTPPQKQQKDSAK
ncbi:MAG TPA: hypothetical protein VL947_01730 [Cytophagales bacterium]|nr:hypothetical protein [Cytophagales bacterium]